MPVDKGVIVVLREWLEKAENDLKAASHGLKLGADCPTDTVCFHAQQCIEKYLKSLLVLKNIEFPKTHNVRLLMELVPVAARLELDPVQKDRRRSLLAAMPPR